MRGVLKMEVKRFLEGEVLFKQGERSDAALIVKRGQVKLSRQTRNGFAKTVATVGPGDIVGELSLVTDAPHSVTATAKEDGEALILTKSDYLSRLKNSDRMLALILKSFAKRLRTTYTAE